MTGLTWIQPLEPRRLLSADLADDVLPEDAGDAETEIVYELDDAEGEEQFAEGDDSSIYETEILILDEDGETATDDDYTEWEEDYVEDDESYIYETEILVIDEGGEVADEEIVDGEDSELVDPPIDRGGFPFTEWDDDMIFWCFRGNIEGIPDGAVAKDDQTQADAETETAARPALLPQPTVATEETNVSAAGNESATEEFLTEKDSTFDPVDALEAISA